MSSQFLQLRISRFALWMVLFSVAAKVYALSLPNSKDLLPTILQLGDSCRSSYECLHHLHHSHCDWKLKVCACQPYHIPFNETWCLPASLLGYGCAVHEQCQVKVKNSECVNGLCQCQQNHISLRKDKCLPPAEINDYCLNDEQCLMSDRHSYCKYVIPRIYGKCQCPLGYLLSEENRCLPHLGSECSNSEECEAVTENSMCYLEATDYPKCICKPGFSISRNRMFCEADLTVQASEKTEDLRSVSIGKPCLNSDQCQARDPHTQCVNGICECMVKTPRCSSKNTGCLNDTFQCTNGQCISWYFVCDGETNCLDGSDEEGCVPFSCPRESFQCNDGTCMSRSVVCNGRWECPDGSDEARCYTGIPCDKNAFRCDNGQCLPLYSFCNAVIDCYDGSDEKFEACEKGDQCPENSFQCKNGRCRSTAILCSGLDGCADNSDETDCEVCYCESP